MAEEITPFRIDVPDTDLADLRDRLRRTRWPDRETVDDWTCTSCTSGRRTPGHCR